MDLWRLYGCKVCVFDCRIASAWQMLCKSMGRAAQLCGGQPKP